MKKRRAAPLHHAGAQLSTVGRVFAAARTAGL